MRELRVNAGGTPMELHTARDPTEVIAASLAGQTIRSLEVIPGGARFKFASGAEVEMTFADLAGHTPGPCEKMVLMVNASFFNSGRVHVTYNHQHVVEPNWKIHRSALKHLVAEIKRNIKWGARVCPYSPGNMRG